MALYSNKISLFFPDQIIIKLILLHHYTFPFRDIVWLLGLLCWRNTCWCCRWVIKYILCCCDASLQLLFNPSYRKAEKCENFIWRQSEWKWAQIIQQCDHKMWGRIIGCYIVYKISHHTILKYSSGYSHTGAQIINVLDLSQVPL